MAGSIADGLMAIVLPRGSGVKNGRGFTPGFNRQQPLMTAPLYRDHLQDVYSSRVANDSRTLIATLANMDPDVSSAINAYLSVAGSVSPVVTALLEGEIDPEGVKIGQALIVAMTTTNDYSLGFSNKPAINDLCNIHRYMCLLRGGTACELVLGKTYVPTELRTVDPATIEWSQSAPSVYKPVQRPLGSNEQIDLNIPTFFTSNFHQSPLDMYTFSPFVSAINTIASRQLVINELYRIMKIVGYPRVDVKVLEDVLVKAAPQAYRSNPDLMRNYIEGELQRVRATISNLQSSDAFVHTSSIETNVINDKNPSAGLQIQGVIDVLNAQNQAALKVMPAVVGKSDNGQVASTEARLFALNADALNRVVADLLSKALTLAARLSGYAGRIEVYFPPVELRPDLELEPQRLMRASRLKEDLSLGIINDDEYSMAMYNRPRREGAEELAGTGFANPNPATVDAEGISPNSDSLGRGLTGEGGNGVGRNNSAKSGNARKKTGAKLVFEF
jgi:hypothetical protein